LATSFDRSLPVLVAQKAADCPNHPCRHYTDGPDTPYSFRHGPAPAAL